MSQTVCHRNDDVNYGNQWIKQKVFIQINIHVIPDLNLPFRILIHILCVKCLRKWKLNLKQQQNLRSNAHAYSLNVINI